MKLRISKKRYRIRNIEQMEEAIREEWENLTPADWLGVLQEQPLKNKWPPVSAHKLSGGSDLPPNG